MMGAGLALARLAEVRFVAPAEPVLEVAGGIDGGEKLPRPRAAYVT